MSDPDFSLGQDDVGVTWDETIRDFYGEPVDMTGGSAVLTFQSKDSPGAVLGGSCSIISEAAPARVRYTFSAPQTATPDLYNARFIATTASGKIVTWPSGRNLDLLITPKLVVPAP